FLLKCNGTFSYLHSFPTRRSSDLGTLQAGTSAVSDKLLDLVGLGGKSAADKERILVIILLLHFLSLMLGSVLVLMLPLLVWLTPDRKSGSAGMPRPISYAVFCLKK